jgi:lipopolysaccharide transport system ATP-binding protein
MPAPVISVENLSKRYLVGHRAERTLDDRFPNFRDMAERGLRNAVRKAADIVHGRQVVQGDALEEFWALRDVSFEVREGEVLGIIGRNGAGKSTLLKILSRITEPTAGRVTLCGRVASLLEVGTGFHPELSGRENVYLNGAILGMGRAEIRRKFDEIVAFAEIEKFLDTPVKRYSSGMYMRLAFAVAAHLEPEILIVDEVLAVGDVEFQKKCLGKMDEVARGGRTVLFVSHNIRAVTALCTRGLLLRDGTVMMSGTPADVVGSYISPDKITTTFHRSPPQSSKPAIVGAYWVHPDETEPLRSWANIILMISSTRQTSVSIDLRLKDRYSNPIGFGSLGAFDLKRPVLIGCGTNTVLVTISTKHLAVGEYVVSIDLTNPYVEFIDRVEDCIKFEIYADHRPDSGRDFEQRWGYGSTLLPLTFKMLDKASASKCEGELSHVPDDGNLIS